jgi:hypothetical protein
MLKNKNFLIGYRLFFGLLGFAAIITEIAVISERGNFNPANFFSFFTIQTNILVFLTFTLGAIMIATGKPKRWMDGVRAAVTFYALVVGIVFAALLSGYEVLTAVAWDNVVLHYIIPIAVIVDFLIDRPKQKISFKIGLWWLVYPIAYAAYSLIRGSIVDWYPYPFLNPATHGYGGVAITVIGLVIFGALLIAAITRLTKKSKTRS